MSKSKKYHGHSEFRRFQNLDILDLVLTDLPVDNATGLPSVKICPYCKRKNSTELVCREFETIAGGARVEVRYLHCVDCNGYYAMF